MIKKISALTEEEKRVLNSMYINYFKNYGNLKSSNYSNRLNYLLIRAMSRVYATKMMDMLNRGERFGYACFLEDKLRGFVVGRLYDDDEAWISHLSVEGETFDEKRMIALQLFKSIAEEFRNEGKKIISIESSIDSPDLEFILSKLDFTLTKKFENGDDIYEKRL